MVWEIDAAPTRFLAPPYRHGVNEGRRDRDSNLVLGAAEVRINDTIVTVPALCANCEDSSAVVLSGLGSAAFVLAVYASQLGLLRLHARLASGWWLAFAGRALTRGASFDRFPLITYMALSFPRLPWCDGTELRPVHLPVGSDCARRPHTDLVSTRDHYVSTCDDLVSPRDDLVIARGDPCQLAPAPRQHHRSRPSVAVVARSTHGRRTALTGQRARVTSRQR